MSIQRAQGWALVVSGVIGVLSIVASDSPVFRILFVAGALLLILGVPAIESAQRSGTLGWLGILLIELGAVIALVISLAALAGNAGVSESLALVSALAATLGRVIVGWLTTRAKVFPAWAGWAFIAEGLLNLLGGMLGGSLLAPVLRIIVPLLGAAALLGYGWTIARHESGRVRVAA